MLKLTRYSPKVTVYVAPAHIAAIVQEYNCAKLELAGGSILMVTETAKDIMAMDEMMYHLHPPIVIQSSTKVV